MNLPFFVARKYFFSGKVSGVIHIIAGISLLGITVGSMALITILSAFNGFEELISRMYNTFDSDIRITPREGKYFQLTAQQIAEIQKIAGKHQFSPAIEENALIKFGEKQTIATIKAIEPKYLPSMGLDTMVVSGDPILEEEGYAFALVGIGVASKLDLGGRDDVHSLQIFSPRKGHATVLNPEKAFNRANILPSGIFSSLEEFDSKYVLTPLGFARGLLEQPTRYTALEINLDQDSRTDDVKRQIKRLLGAGYQVHDRYEQQPVIYRVMRTEKFAVYLILSFVILIAAFNLVGTLLMLAIEKKRDMMTLISLGARAHLIEDIILMEGMMISLIGGIVGMSLGALLCFLQMKFGFVQIAENSTFVYNAYPVAFNPWDFIIVLTTVLFLGFLASWYPAKAAFRRLTVQDLRR